MRQAGRSLPEYRQSRAGVDMLEACLRPELAAEITLQPVRRHGVDAAVFFSDIVTPVLLAGVDVSIVAGRGPVLAEPVRTASDVLAAHDFPPEWKQWECVLLMKPGEDPRELGRRRDIWLMPHSLKAAARMLMFEYEAVACSGTAVRKIEVWLGR